MKRRTTGWMGLFLLVSLLACGGGGGGGGGSSSSSTTLSFSTTATTSEYRFVENTSQSSDSRLVLDLYGPTGITARGVAIFLTTDTSMATWVNPSTGSSTGSLITVGSQFVVDKSPKLVKSLVSDSTPENLQVGVFQKGGAAVTYSSSTPILSVALAPVPGAASGTVKFVAASSPDTPSSIFLSGDDPGIVQGITIKCGTVSVQ